MYARYNIMCGCECYISSKRIHSSLLSWRDRYLKKLKDIIYASILSTPEGVIDNSPNVHLTLSPVKKPSAMKSLCLFTNILDVQPETAKRRFVAAKPRRKSMKVCNSLWGKKNEKGIQK